MHQIDENEAKSKTYMSRMLQVMNGKLDISFKDEISKKLKEYSSFQDIKELADKVLPPIQEFVTNLN